MRSFSSVEDARFEAQRIATAIADGEADVLKLKSADRASYLHAIRELKPFGVPLHIAISEYVAARKHAGAGLITAAKDYAQRHAFITARKTVAKVVEEILNAKEQDGMSVRYLQSLRSHLNRFAKHFGMNISTVTAAQIEDWLRSNQARSADAKQHPAFNRHAFQFRARPAAICQNRSQPKPITSRKRRTAAAKSGSSSRNNSPTCSMPLMKRPNFILRLELSPACARPS